jgi:predicted PurR-regulated permease PerM
MADSRHWFILALTVGTGWMIYQLAPVITPFVISAGLAFLGDPLVDRLEQVKFLKWTFSSGSSAPRCRGCRPSWA